MKYWVFICCAIIAILPWTIHPGYLLFMDWQGTPSISWTLLDDTNGIAGFPVTISWRILALITGTGLAQKILIGIALALAGSSTATLAYKLTKREFSSLLAGVFAMSNFFILNRIMLGHIYVLFGYALAPLAVMATLRYIEHQSRKNLIVSALLNALVIFTSVHFIILLPILLCCCIPLSSEYKKLTLKHWGAIILPLALASGVAITFLFAPSHPAITQLHKNDVALFAPQPQCFTHVFFDSVILASNWRNPVSFHPPCGYNRIAVIGTILLFVPILWGIMQKKVLGVAIGILILLAITPIIPAMRDSGKFLANLAIIESIALAYGLPNRKIISAGLVATATLPLLVTIPHLATPQQYPMSWYEWNNRFATSTEKPVTLFLPWHMYMPFDFTNNQTIGNPAHAFFTNITIIQGDNYEMRRGDVVLTSQSNLPISKKVESALTHINSTDFPDVLRDLLIREHIQYIALAHGSPEEALYEQKIASAPYLAPDYSKPGLTVWRFVQ